MALFFQQDIDETTRLALWKIEEDEAFFTQHVPLQRTITHPHKRLQHLAGRYLLKYLFPDFPIALIQIADTRKPYLKDEAYHFSISHCGDYAGVIVSRNRKVGMDIELFTPKIEKIAHKFVADTEWAIVNGSVKGENSNVKEEVDEQAISNSKLQIPNSSPRTALEYLTLLWSCKEALFKWYGLGEVGFIRHMELKQIETIGEQQYELGFLFKKEKDLLLSLRSCFFKELVL